MTERFENGRLTERRFGFATEAPAPCASAGARMQITTLGLDLSQGQALLGYRSADLLCLPLAACGAIFFVSSDARLDELQTRFPDIDSACLVHDTPLPNPEN